MEDEHTGQHRTLESRLSALEQARAADARAQSIVGWIATLLATIALAVAGWGIQRGEELATHRAQLASAGRRIEVLEAQAARVDSDRRELATALAGVQAQLAAQTATLGAISERMRGIESRLEARR